MDAERHSFVMSQDHVLFLNINLNEYTDVSLLRYG